MDLLASESRPVLGGLDVLPQRLVDVIGAHVELAHLLSEGAETA